MRLTPEQQKEVERLFDEKFPRCIISINESVIGWRDERMEADGKIMKDFLISQINHYSKEAYSRGYENGKLAELEDSVGAEIEIAKEKIEQIKQEERKRVSKVIEKCKDNGNYGDFDSSDVESWNKALPTALDIINEKSN